MSDSNIYAEFFYRLNRISFLPHMLVLLYSNVDGIILQNNVKQSILFQ